MSRKLKCVSYHLHCVSMQSPSPFDVQGQALRLFQDACHSKGQSPRLAHLSALNLAAVGRKVLHPHRSAISRRLICAPATQSHDAHSTLEDRHAYVQLLQARPPVTSTCKRLPVSRMFSMSAGLTTTRQTDRQSGFGAPANLADWPRQGSNPGPTGFEAKRLSRPVSQEPTPLISGRNARFHRAISTLPGSG